MKMLMSLLAVMALLMVAANPKPPVPAPDTVWILDDSKIVDMPNWGVIQVCMVCHWNVTQYDDQFAPTIYDENLGTWMKMGVTGQPDPLVSNNFKTYVFDWVNTCGDIVMPLYYYIDPNSRWGKAILNGTYPQAWCCLTVTTEKGALVTSASAIVYFKP
jgi:hypothetical protein